MSSPFKVQPTPHGKGVDVAGLVHHDIEKRVAYGKLQYGERLTTLNGRDALQDAYEEALDLALYLRQAIWEHDHHVKPERYPGAGGVPF